MTWHSTNPVNIRSSRPTYRMFHQPTRLMRRFPEPLDTLLYPTSSQIEHLLTPSSPPLMHVLVMSASPAYRARPSEAAAPWPPPPLSGVTQVTRRQPWRRHLSQQRRSSADVATNSCATAPHLTSGAGTLYTTDRLTWHNADTSGEQHRSTSWPDSVTCKLVTVRSPWSASGHHRSSQSRLSVICPVPETSLAVPVRRTSAGLTSNIIQGLTSHVWRHTSSLALGLAEHQLTVT